MTGAAPPLGVCTGVVEPGVAFGGFGPASAFAWRGSCVGGCGGRPMCAEELPAPECSGCARVRHRLPADTPRVPWRPAVHALGMYRVLVTASRTWDDAATLRAALDERAARYGARLVVLTGACPDGGDAIADAWYVERYGPRDPERWPADWSTYGRAAGPIRNSAMVASRPAECLAFLRDGSRGTADCAGKAERAGIPTTRYLYGQPRQQPDAAPTAAALTSAILRPATEVSPHDPSLPRGVRTLAELAPAALTRVTLAMHAAAGLIVASLAVRVRGVGHVVYERPEGGAWRYARGAVLAPRPRHRLPARPHLMRANVGRFTAALLGEEYDPNPVPDVAEPVRTVAPKGRCPGCGAEVSLTKAGAVYASHKCQTRAIEGRS